jgi:hypothetical protein
MMRRMPSAFAGASAGSALTAVGLWYVVSSTRPSPSRAFLAGVFARQAADPEVMSLALGVEVEQRILEARAKTNLGPAPLARLVGYRRSTIWKVLHRHGCSQRRGRAVERQTTKRFEWSRPGALHIETIQLAKFDAPSA